MDSPEIPMKRCCKKESCVHPESQNGWLPKTATYFSTRRINPDGLRYECRACAKVSGAATYKRHAERLRKEALERRNANIELARARRRDYYARNRETILPKELADAKKRYEKDPEFFLERARRYNQENRESVAKGKRKWHEAHPASVKASRLRRKDRVRNLPNKFSGEDWDRALSYFGHRCAICGQDENLWVRLAADHWIPVSSPGCPGTIPTNIIPLCHAKPGIPSGIACCNQSKWNKNPIHWLTKRFGKRKADAIRKRIEDYFEWVKCQES